ncbi:MAG: hypothetical protein MUC36_02925 [Planctomycetes bacterium]|nr:hypothetical protein [Planctomycetota bacterium]
MVGTCGGVLDLHRSGRGRRLEALVRLLGRRRCHRHPRPHQQRSHAQRRQHHRGLAEVRKARQQLAAQFRRDHREHRIAASLVTEHTDRLERTVAQPVQDRRRRDGQSGQVRAGQQVAVQRWVGSSHEWIPTRSIAARSFDRAALDGEAGARASAGADVTAAW